MLVQSTTVENGRPYRFLYTCIVKEIWTNKRNLEKKSGGARHDDIVHTMINPLGYWLFRGPRDQMGRWSRSRRRCNHFSHSVSQFCCCWCRGSPNRFLQSFHHLHPGELQMNPQCRRESFLDQSGPTRAASGLRSWSLGRSRFLWIYHLEICQGTEWTKSDADTDWYYRTSHIEWQNSPRRWLSMTACS